MINLKIDPEFQSQIPPLTDDEFKQLEENILKEGKLLSYLSCVDFCGVRPIRGAPCFCFAINLPIRGFQPHFAGIPLVRRSESNPRSPASHSR